MKRQPTAHVGKRIGRYRIERELGRGGMGVVYLATDETLARQVALKTTSVAGLGGEGSRNQRRARFIREVQALAQVSHPGVVHVYDAGEEDDADLGWMLFYSMEFVDGITLAQRVHQFGALKPGESAAVCAQVASGLGAAHERGIVHRDVKPANIFLSGEGRALIGDFGICKIEGSTQITRRDQLVGTPNYLAPEQILGEAIGPPTDVFAIGALFYVITFNRPLRARVDASSLLASAQSDEARARVLGESSLSPGLREVLARALERDPDKRYASGERLAEALAEHQTQPPSLDGDGARPRARSGTSDDDEHASAFTSGVDDDDGEVDDVDNRDLPVARSEATALFRHEGALRPDERDPGLLPVARTESTQMFNLAQLAEQAPARIGSSDEGEAAETPAHVDRPLPPSSPLAAVEILRAAEPSLPWQRIVGPVGVSAAVGVVIGVIILVLAVFAQRLLVGELVPDRFVGNKESRELFLASMPAECREMPKSTDDVRRSEQLLGHALSLFVDNKSRDSSLQVASLVDDALALDPQNAAAHALRARLRRQTGDSWLADLAEQCVCAVAESSLECKHVRSKPVERR